MSALESRQAGDIRFVDDVFGDDLDSDSSVRSLLIEIGDNVPSEHHGPDTLTWTGKRRFLIGGVDGAKKLHEELGQKITHWESLQAKGHVQLK